MPFKSSNLKLELLPFFLSSPKRNIEIDTELPLRAQKEGKIYFRWYGWNKLSLSFGFSQKKLMETFQVNLPKVLRPTGGGILIHGLDISFAIGVPSGVFKGIFDLYRFVAECFVETFERLDVNEVSFSRKRSSDYTRDGLCVTFPTFGEVTYKNKKLVAAAVREFEPKNFLIHGSIYIGYNFAKAAQIFKTKPEFLQKKVVSLQALRVKKLKLIVTFNEIFEKELRKKVL